MAISVVKPTIGGSTGQWGALINAALDTLVTGTNDNAAAITALQTALATVNARLDAAGAPNNQPGTGGTNTPPAPSGTTVLGYGSGTVGTTVDSTLWTKRTSGNYATTTYTQQASSTLLVTTPSTASTYDGYAHLQSIKTQQTGLVSGQFTTANKNEHRFYVGAYCAVDPNNGNLPDGYALNFLPVSNQVSFVKIASGAETAIGSTATITFSSSGNVIHWIIQPGVGATVWLDGATQPTTPNFPATTTQFPLSSSGCVMYHINSGGTPEVITATYGPVTFDPLTGPVSVSPPADAAISTDLTKPYAPTGVKNLAWTVDFQDDFTGSALDGTKWVDHEPFYSSPGYGDSTIWQPVPADTTVLSFASSIVSMKVRAATGLPGGAGWKGVQLSTRGKYATPALTAGHAVFIEARLYNPSGRALWPAFWTEGDGDLHTANDSHTGWPTKGENDIYEFFNLKNGIGDLYWSLHYPADVYTNPPGTWLNDTHVYQSSTGRTDLMDSFHTWGMYVDTTKMEVYIDGTLWKTYLPNTTYSGNTIAVPPMLFTNPMFIRMGLSIGGYAGTGYATTQYQEGDMKCDYVRVWKL